MWCGYAFFLGKNTTVNIAENMGAGPRLILQDVVLLSLVSTHLTALAPVSVAVIRLWCELPLRQAISPRFSWMVAHAMPA